MVNHPNRAKAKTEICGHCGHQVVFYPRQTIAGLIEALKKCERKLRDLGYTGNADIASAALRAHEDNQCA